MNVKTQIMAPSTVPGILQWLQNQQMRFSAQNPGEVHTVLLYYLTIQSHKALHSVDVRVKRHAMKMSRRFVFRQDNVGKLTLSLLSLDTPHHSRAVSA